MAIRRIMGLETEYSFIPSTKDNRILSEEIDLRPLCDNESTTRPLQDLILNCYSIDLDGAEFTGHFLNAMMRNGSRVYQDTGLHPEYSTPECSNPRSLVIATRAGDELMYRASIDQVTSREIGNLFKDNTGTQDEKSWGAHENYLVDRNLDFYRLSEFMIPFFVSRQIFTGAGKIRDIFEISQRANHIHEIIGCNTVDNRSIINTRDEPHANRDKYRRFHVINGDANMCDVATYLKFGTTCLVLDLIEDDLKLENSVDLYNPVKSFHQVSRDATLKQKLRLENGLEATAIEIQRQYYERAKEAYLGKRDEITDDILYRWGQTLDCLEINPDLLIGKIDWITKRTILDSKMRKKGLKLHDPEIRMRAAAYHKIGRDAIFDVLRKKGTIEELTTKEEIEDAIRNPPRDTRAYLRANLLRTGIFEPSIADWDVLKPGRYFGNKLYLNEPFMGTEEQFRHLFDGDLNDQQIIEALKFETKKSI